MTPRYHFIIWLAAMFCTSCSTPRKPQAAVLSEIERSRCEIRYNFRERTTSDQGDVSAPAFEARALPSWKTTNSGNHVASVEGNVEGMPYQFRIYLQSTAAHGELQLNVNATSHDKSLKGFPVTIDNALEEIKKGVMIEVPVDDTVKKQIEKQILHEDDFLTYVSVVIRTTER